MELDLHTVLFTCGLFPILCAVGWLVITHTVLRP